MVNQTPPKAHVLNFFYDDDDCCALTTVVNNVRFHIVADPCWLGSDEDSGSKIQKQYIQKLKILRIKDEEAEGDPGPSENRQQNESSEVRDREQVPQLDDPTQFDEEREERTRSPDSAEDKDSAIDVGADHKSEHVKQTDTNDEGVVVGKESANDASPPDTDLQNWLLSCLGEEIAKLAPETRDRNSRTLHEWYNRPTYFFRITENAGVLEPVRLKDTAELNEDVRNTIPRLPMPKYIRERGIPWFESKDLEVLAESSDPEPLHPSTVKFGDDVYFFKPVDMTQPQPTKREIKLLKDIEDCGLHTEIRVPRICGLVGFEDSKNEVMGSLLTNIEEAIPLTRLLDTNVPQGKREKWAKESARIVGLLHKHKIIWGDAKADNFLVDKDDVLWIIDFGGSYTEGWVDPNLKETEQGDDMGLDKIVCALEDPVENTFDPDGEDSSNGGLIDEQRSDSSRKRKRSRTPEQVDGSAQVTASVKRNSTKRPI